MQPSFLKSYAKDSRIYIGNFPVVLDGAINCVGSSTQSSTQIPFPDEDCNCDAAGYYTISPISGISSFDYICIDGSIIPCYQAAGNVSPFVFDGPVFDVDYDFLSGKIWVVGNFLGKIKRLNSYMDLDTSFNPNPEPTVNFNQIYNLSESGGCFLGTISNVTPHTGATPARGFKYSFLGDFDNGFSITDTSWSGEAFPFVVLENIDIIHHCSFTNFSSYDFSTGSRVYYETLSTNAHGISTNFNRDKIVFTARPTIGGPGGNPLNPKSIKYLNGSSLLLDSTFSSGAGTGLNASTFAGVLYNGSMPKISTNPTNTFIYTNTNSVGLTWGGTNYAWNGGDPTKHTCISKIGVNGIEDPSWNTTGNSFIGNQGYWSIFTIDSLDRIYVGGPIDTIRGNSVLSNRLYRLLSNGDYDSSFDLVFNDIVRGAMWYQPDNSLLVWGDFTEVSGDSNKRYIIKISL